MSAQELGGSSTEGPGSQASPTVGLSVSQNNGVHALRSVVRGGPAALCDGAPPLGGLKVGASVRSSGSWAPDGAAQKLSTPAFIPAFLGGSTGRSFQPLGPPSPRFGLGDLLLLRDCADQDKSGASGTCGGPWTAPSLPFPSWCLPHHYLSRGGCKGRSVPQVRGPSKPSSHFPGPRAQSKLGENRQPGPGPDPERSARPASLATQSPPAARDSRHQDVPALEGSAEGPRLSPSWSAPGPGDGATTARGQGRPVSTSSCGKGGLPSV